MAKEKNEMLYVIPLQPVYWGRRRNRAPRAIKILKEFASRHFRMEPAKIRVSNKVNELIWSRGLEKPPRRVQVKIVKTKKDDEEYLYILLPDEKPPEEE